jgi:tetratricopeptide (TPR) repeat protein
MGWRQVKQGFMVRGRFSILAAGAWAAMVVPVHAGGAGAPQPPAEAGAVQLVRGNNAEAVTSFTEALKDSALSNDRRAAILSDRGVAYMRSGQPKLAIEDFNRAAQLFPEYAAIYNNRGTVLVSLGLLKEAIKDFDRALVLAPGYAAAYNNRAGALMKLGQVSNAILDYTKGVQLMPQSPAPLSGRGQAYLMLGKPYAAMRDFTRAVNADARFATGYRNRAEAKLAVDQFEEATEDLSRAIAFEVDNAEHYVLRGMAYHASKNPVAAIKDFTRAIELDDKLTTAYQERGLAYGMSEAYQEAFADLNYAIELDPRSAVAFAYRAYVYKRSNQIDIGARDLATAEKLDSNRPEVWWAKAELAESQGQVEEAIQHARQALALRPSYRPAQEITQRLGAFTIEDEEEVAELGLDAWRVISRNGRLVAVNSEFPTTSVPLETLGEGQPKILGWELKKPPFKGIGVLRFHGGTVRGRKGPEEVELAALIDVEEGRVIAIEPHKQGDAVATWTWEEGKVTVASVDGATDEFNLRVGLAATPGVGQAWGSRQQSSSQQAGFGFWQQFGQPWGGPGGAPPPKQSQRYTQKKKAKSIFDLLFN